MVRVKLFKEDIYWKDHPEYSIQEYIRDAHIAKEDIISLTSSFYVTRDNSKEHPVVVFTLVWEDGLGFPEKC